MEFELFLNCNKSQNEYALYLKKLFNEKLNTDILRYHEHDDYIDLTLENMSITFDLDGIYGEDVIEEDFDFNVTTCANIQVISKFRDSALELLFKVIKVIVIEDNYDLLLLGENATLILKKEESRYFTSNLEKDYYFEFPFDLLEVKIEKNRENM